MILYIFQLTFFGGVMAISGYAEDSNRHSVTCLKVPSKQKARELTLTSFLSVPRSDGAACMRTNVRPEQQLGDNS